MTELPQEIIEKYSINVTESIESPGIIMYHFHFATDNYVGVVNPIIKERTHTWDLVSPGGTVVSLYKNVKCMHVSCL
jgi:hypothetical protein